MTFFRFSWRLRFLNNVVFDEFTLLSRPRFIYSVFWMSSPFESSTSNWLIYRLSGPQNWEKIPFCSERSCHSKAWFSIKKDSIVIKTKVFSIWSIFVCGGGGSKKKRVIAFARKPNPASNLISLRCYICSDNEDSKKVSNAVRDLERFDSKEEGQLEAKHFFLLTFHLLSFECFLFKLVNCC